MAFPRKYRNHSRSERAGFFQLEDESLNPRVFVHGRAPDLIVRPEEVGDHLPHFEGGRYHIDDADTHVKPFILTGEPMTPIRTRKLRIHVGKPSPLCDVVLQPHPCPFTGSPSFETMNHLFYSKKGKKNKGI